MFILVITKTAFNTEPASLQLIKGLTVTLVFPSDRMMPVSKHLNGTYVILSFLVVLHVATCYPTGTPSSACGNMVPKHGTGAQTTVSPYTVTVSSSMYKCGESVTGIHIHLLPFLYVPLSVSPYVYLFITFHLPFQISSYPRIIADHAL